METKAANTRERVIACNVHVQLSRNGLDLIVTKLALTTSESACPESVTGAVLHMGSVSNSKSHPVGRAHVNLDCNHGND